MPTKEVRCEQILENILRLTRAGIKLSFDNPFPFTDALTVCWGDEGETKSHHHIDWNNKESLTDVYKELGNLVAKIMEEYGIE